MPGWPDPRATTATAGPTQMMRTFTVFGLNDPVAIGVRRDMWEQPRC